MKSIILFLVCCLAFIGYFLSNNFKSKCAIIGEDFSVCYDNRFDSKLYILWNRNSEIIDTAYNNTYMLFHEYYWDIQNEKFYMNTTGSNYKKFYWVLDINSRIIIDLKSDEMVGIDGETIRVREINFKNPYWLILFD